MRELHRKKSIAPTQDRVRRRLGVERLEDRTVPNGYPPTFTVTNPGDNFQFDPTTFTMRVVNPAPFAGTGTLRQAIIDAQYILADNDQIVIAPSVSSVMLGAALPTLLETHTIKRASTPSAGRVPIFPVFGFPGIGLPGSYRFLDVAINGAGLTLENLAISGFGAPGGDGGAIRTPGSLTVTNCSFTDCVAVNGGAIATDSDAPSLGSLTITDSEFESNTASGSGGAIFSAPSFSAPPVVILDTEFFDNDAGVNGGAIFSQSAAGALTLSGCQFDMNEALTGSGGAVFMNGGSSLTANASLFQLNTANGGSGGAIFMDGVNGLTANGSVFFMNVAGVNGGGVAVLNPFSVTIDSDFQNNAAAVGLGDGIFVGMTPRTQPINIDTVGILDEVSLVPIL
jgi:predicted outer membrane repeat protein